MRSTWISVLTASWLAGLACNGKGGATDSDAGTTASASSTTNEVTTTASTTGVSTTGVTTTASTTEVTTTASTTASTGEASASSGDTGVVSAPCDVDADCMLVESCCQCEAVALGAAVEPCDMPCDQTKCSALNLFEPAAVCRLDVCVLAAQRCSPNLVTCDELPPECQPGLVPAVVAGCWGGCVAAHLCDELPGCTHELCGPGWMCVESQSGAFAPHCEPIPPPCGATPGCDCAAGVFGQVCGGACSEDSSRLLCEDGG